LREASWGLRKVFRVVRCPRCGFLQLTMASKIVKCFSCGYSWQLDSKSILFSSPDSEKAREFLLRLKRESGLSFRKASEEAQRRKDGSP